MKIKEDIAHGLVFVDGNPISGFLDEDICQKCKLSRIYSDKYDSYFCMNCDVWIESKCKDLNCDYCSERPAKPSMMFL